MVRLRQSYSRVAKAAAMTAGRHAHADSSGGISDSCASCAPGSAGSFAAFAARSMASRRWRTRSPFGSAGPRKSARSSASAAGSSIPFMPGGRVHRQRQGRRALRIRLKASIVTNNRRAPGGLFVLHASARPESPLRRSYLARRRRSHRDTHQLSERAGLCRQGISRPRRAKSPSRLHLRPETRCLRCHQTRAAPPLRHRAHHRTPESGRSPRPLLPQWPRRRCRQCHPLRCWLQLPPYSRLAESSSAPHPDRIHHCHQRLLSAQPGFLTDE